MGWIKFARLGFDFFVFLGRPLTKLVFVFWQRDWRFWLGIGVGIAGLIIWFWLTLPSPQKLIRQRPRLTTKILDRHGTLLYKIYREENRTWVPLHRIPKEVIWATLAAEDKEFFSHPGFSPKGILRAFWYNFTHPGQPQMGGSTITQQLVKNALLGPEKTWRRKIKEIVLALWVETKFSKEEILEMYLNWIPYGGTAWGVEEAAQRYFGKHIWEVNLAEAALLAGLPKAPSRFSPFGPYPQLAKKRQIWVLGEMVKAGFVEPQAAQKAAAASLRFVPQREKILAPHFVFWVKNKLVQRWGIQAVETGGLWVKTTLDYPLQQFAEKVVRTEVERLKSLRVGNGAALIVLPKTGEILAMVGSKDWFDFAHDGNVNLVLALRQPGSAIKVVNYALALSSGYTPATIIPDTPVTYKVIGAPPYSPRNYDGRFHGLVTLRTALASSLNVPAVKVLASLGVERMIEMGQKLGIESWSKKEVTSRFGLSLTLGGGEVRLIELAQVYAVLANLGEKIPFEPILEVRDWRGHLLWENRCAKFGECQREQVLDPGVAFLLNDILADNNARALGFGTNSLLNISGARVAVKTGTSNNLRDNWCFGYTPDFVVATWVGNNDNSPMSGVASGITGATPIWRRLTLRLLQIFPARSWQKPANVLRLPICATTGTLPCPGCPKIVWEYFLRQYRPTTYCHFKETDLDLKKQ